MFIDEYIYICVCIYIIYTQIYVHVLFVSCAITSSTIVSMV